MMPTRRIAALLLAGLIGCTTPLSFLNWKRYAFDEEVFVVTNRSRDGEGAFSKGRGELRYGIAHVVKSRVEPRDSAERQRAWTGDGRLSERYREAIDSTTAI